MWKEDEQGNLVHALDNDGNKIIDYQDDNTHLHWTQRKWRYRCVGAMVPNTEANTKVIQKQQRYVFNTAQKAIAQGSFSPNQNQVIKAKKTPNQGDLGRGGRKVAKQFDDIVASGLGHNPFDQDPHNKNKWIEESAKLREEGHRKLFPDYMDMFDPNGPDRCPCPKHMHSCGDHAIRPHWFGQCTQDSVLPNNV